MGWRSGALLALGFAIAGTGAFAAVDDPAAREALAEKDAGQLVDRFREIGSRLGDAVVIRVFKGTRPPSAGPARPSDQGYLELWVSGKDGRFNWAKTYAIDNFSGTLGPKLKEGDGQAPEGFYSIKWNSLKPDSAYFLAMNIGFPNPYDRSLGRTGSYIMIHGPGKSTGCYALSQRDISEIYTAVKKSMEATGLAVPVEVFPFPLKSVTADSAPIPGVAPEVMDFWRNLAEGGRLFERDRLAPLVDVQNGRYVFQSPLEGPNRLLKARRAPESCDRPPSR